MSQYSYTVRLYASDDSFTKLPPIPAGVREIRVALAFARDYDGDKPTNGKFKPYWNTNKVTPSVITQFKEAHKSLEVKVLVSIGDRNDQYPFTVEHGSRAEWVKNATESLTSIIQLFNLDGIDVYYESIAESGQQYFVDYIGQLITNLKESRVISVASIASTAPLNSKFYFPLYQKFGNYIDTIVYQFFTEPKPITSLKNLVDNIKTIANQYPKAKFLAGYSTISSDWARVSPPLYFFALFQLLTGQIVAGPAIWVVSDSPAPGVSTSDSVTTFEILEWILEVVSLARNGRGIV